MGAHGNGVGTAGGSLSQVRGPSKGCRRRGGTCCGQRAPSSVGSTPNLRGCPLPPAPQFLLQESDVGQDHVQASQRRLAELNPDVEVAVSTEELSEDFLEAFQVSLAPRPGDAPGCWHLLTTLVQVVVLTESPLEEQLRVGDICHAKGICFIVADAKGLAG